MGFLCWAYLTDLDPERIFEFGMWAGFGTMVPGLLIATGASDNTFEEGENYNSVRDTSQKQERIRGTIPILVTTVLAGVLVIITCLVARYIIFPLLELGG